ncbi:MAG: hypothetical protein MZW92_30430 [Comamonadaceae bacterium]|nr:hypothetical protein [Comamonadaceae bacterium]
MRWRAARVASPDEEPAGTHRAPASPSRRARPAPQAGLAVVGVGPRAELGGVRLDVRTAPSSAGPIREARCVRGRTRRRQLRYRRAISDGACACQCADRSPPRRGAIGPTRMPAALSKQPAIGCQPISERRPARSRAPRARTRIQVAAQFEALDHDARPGPSALRQLDSAAGAHRRQAAPALRSRRGRAARRSCADLRRQLARLAPRTTRSGASCRAAAGQGRRRAGAAASARLQQDHGWLEEDWLELAPQIEAIAEGYSLVRPGRRCASALRGLHRAVPSEHIALEESLIYPPRAAVSSARGRRDAAPTTDSIAAAPGARALDAFDGRRHGAAPSSSSRCAAPASSSTRTTPGSRVSTSAWKRSRSSASR